MRVYGFVISGTSKPPLIESLILAFEKGEIGILGDDHREGKVLISELEAYERKVSPMTGRSQYSAPEGLHDDTVIALALAWNEVQRGVPSSGRNPFFDEA